MRTALRPVIGLVTIGQSPRPDVVPDMAEVIGPGVEIRVAGALDGLARSEIDALAPRGDDEILVTRLRDGAPVFLGRQRIEALLEQRIAALEAGGATLTALMCTGDFPKLRASRPIVQPQPVLVGALRGMAWPGRLGVVVPSVPHIPQGVERWRGEGFDPVVVALSPYEEEDPAAVRRAATDLPGVGLVVMDCMGFGRKTRDEMRELTGVPVLLANLLVARVVAELCGT
jgi:protein AroM